MFVVFLSGEEKYDCFALVRVYRLVHFFSRHFAHFSQWPACIVAVDPVAHVRPEQNRRIDHSERAFKTEPEQRMSDVRFPNRPDQCQSISSYTLSNPLPSLVFPL